ncbi:hypothetical protein K474DRAFT_1661749 [Panus rudis PR-1116 ss-1]|nr:hypothetical protein K474DRAFT_1661749 [Panus rudis PR-1116 ss-1]
MVRKRQRKTDANGDIATASTSSGAVTGTPDGRRDQRVRGKRGGLQEFPNMPLDIVFEVLVRLQPADLLSLSRTSKAFRVLLMSRSAILYWKGARRNVPGLPECPEDMSEPAYASLVFDTRCQGCPKTHIPEPIWQFRRRYCNQCKEANSTPSSETVAKLELATGMSDLVFPLPHAYLYGLVPGGRKMNYAIFHKPDVETLLHRLSSMTAEDKVAYIKQMQDKADEIREHAVKCMEWAYRRKANRQEELNALRMARVKAIEDKLVEEGWGPEVDYMTSPDGPWFPENPNSHPLLDFPIVRQPKPLTSRAWPKVYQEILPMLKEFRKQVREFRF